MLLCNRAGPHKTLDAFAKARVAHKRVTEWVEKQITDIDFADNAYRSVVLIDDSQYSHRAILPKNFQRLAQRVRMPNGKSGIAIAAFEIRDLLHFSTPKCIVLEMQIG
jgi:hypothetical protein